MSKKKLIILIILTIIILGLLIAPFFEYNMCEEMACPCELNELDEIPCNSCTNINPIFVLGAINVIKVCSAQQVILCEEGTSVGIRYDVDKETCKIKWRFFTIRY